MPCSPEQQAANRRNATRSTGPSTPEGKEISRRNSLKHGLTGHGVALPIEDSEAIDRRFHAFETRYQPRDDVEAFYVHRAALLSVRLDRSERYQNALLASGIRKASAAFDEARHAEVDRLFAKLATEPNACVPQLLRSPEGIDRMVKAWRELLNDLSYSHVIPWTFEHYERVENLLGRLPDPKTASRALALSSAIVGHFANLQPGEAAELAPEARMAWAKEKMRELIELSLTRLESCRGNLDLDSIHDARAEAVELAIEDDSPTMLLARKYEVSTERSLNQALNHLHKFQARPIVEETASDPVVPEPAPSANEATPEPSDELASFCPETSPPDPEPAAPLADPIPTSSEPHERLDEPENGPNHRPIQP